MARLDTAITTTLVSNIAFLPAKSPMGPSTRLPIGRIR